MTFNFTKSEIKPKESPIPETLPSRTAIQQATEEEDFPNFLKFAEIKTIGSVYLLKNVFIEHCPDYIMGTSESDYLVFIPHNDIVDIIERPSGYKIKKTIFGGLFGWIMDTFF